MADLISRAAAIDEIMQMVKRHEHEIFRGELLHYTGIKAMLESLPAVDAAPVVRCRDCKKWNREWTPAYSKTGPEEYHMCYEVQGPTSADWFCADGERRDA